MESNWRRTGGPQDDELDSAGCDDEPARRRRSPKSVRYAEVSVKSDAGVHHVVGGANVGTVWRDKRGDLRPEVTGSRSQSLRSTDGLKSRAGPNGWETGIKLGELTQVPKRCRGSPKSAEQENRAREGWQESGNAKDRGERQHERISASAAKG